MNIVKMMALGLMFSVFTLATVQARADKQEAVDDVERLVRELDSDIQQLKVLSEQTGNADSKDREALVFRQDDRSFRLLADADTLARAVAELPTDNPARMQIEQKLIGDLRNTAEAVFNRLEEIDQQIAKNTAELGSLGAGARISTEAYLQVLESVRFQYYEALINHYESRKILGLPFDDSKERLKSVLYIHAEALVGQIEFSSSALDEVQDRLSQDAANADLAVAAANLATRNSESIDSLSLAIGLLDRLEVDTADYKTVLLQHAGGVSVGLFQSGVMDQLLGDWFDKASESIKENTPNLLLKLLIFFLVLFVFRFLSRLVRRLVRAACDRSSLDMSILLKDILVSVSGGTVMILGILMALSQIGISLGPMLAGLGVAGFVIGFALQDTLGNFAAGAMILTYRPYDVDDFIEVAGTSGLVKKMNLVSTTIVGAARSRHTSSTRGSRSSAWRRRRSPPCIRRWPGCRSSAGGPPSPKALRSRTPDG